MITSQKNEPMVKDNHVQIEEDQVVFNVYKTTDYEKFKILGGNRNLNLLHIKRLVESFENKFLVSPMIVNEKLEVIDGQHRLNASKETGLPLLYIVVPGYSIEDVKIYNVNQHNWKKQDYLKMYCDAGVKEYLIFRKFMVDFPDFGIQSSERVITQIKGQSTRMVAGHKVSSKDFESGDLKIPDINKSYSIARKVIDFKPFYKNYHRGIFVSTMLDLFDNPNYNHREMIRKLGTTPIQLQDCPTVETYKILMEDIYNYKRNEENKVSFKYKYKNNNSK